MAGCRLGRPPRSGLHPRAAVGGRDLVAQPAHQHRPLRRDGRRRSPENQDIQQAVAAGGQRLVRPGRPGQADRERAPERAGFLGEPIANAMRGYATDLTEKLSRHRFPTLWDNVNRRAARSARRPAHRRPRSRRGRVRDRQGKVTLDLNTGDQEGPGRLVAAGLTFLEEVNVPPVKRTVAIINTEGLAEARGYVSILDTLAWVLPVLGVLALIGSALVVPTRRRAHPRRVRARRPRARSRSSCWRSAARSTSTRRRARG